MRGSEVRGKENLVSDLILEVNWEEASPLSLPLNIPFFYIYPFYIPSIENWYLLDIHSKGSLFIIAGGQKRARRRSIVGGVVRSNL